MKTICFILSFIFILTGCYLHRSQRKSNILNTADKSSNDTLKVIPDSVYVSPLDTAGLMDYDGNIYKTVRIGKQTWMAENLRVTHFNDGTPVPYITDVTEWSNLTTPAFSWYGNDSATYAGSYGALYNWYSVHSGKLCPEGWYVSRDSEWEILTNYLGGKEKAGGKLKDIDTTHWYYPNTGATNETGFTALPGGGRCTDGIFGNLGLNSIFWTSTEFDDNYALFRNISHYYQEVYGYGSNKKNGFSVRCLKDK